MVLAVLLDLVAPLGNVVQGNNTKGKTFLKPLYKNIHSGTITNYDENLKQSTWGTGVV